MNEEVFEKEFEEIESIIRRHQRFLILGHVDPDGDCIGSVLAFAQFLLGRGKEVMCYVPGEIPGVYMKLPCTDLLVSESELSRFGQEAIFALDVPTTVRTADLFQLNGSQLVVNIDHHPTNEHYGYINVVDENACATTVLIYRFLCTVAPDEITPNMADCLYVGVLLDTGGFRFQNTNAEALATAAELVERGARASELAHEFIHVKKLKTLKLLAMSLQSIEVHCEGKIAAMEISSEMIEKSGGSLKDTEGFIDYANAIDDVELSALFRGVAPGEIRISLRSRNELNVAELAGRYGGGGHRNAAGLVMYDDLETAKSLILGGLKELLENRGDSTIT
ncbi:MAG: DHH family phosphoesterase [Candidatus Krumholzibacteria bacterium]|nr:DHH family phosphoesterase [Candidatus Krumholzibacteria bacterium]